MKHIIIVLALVATPLWAQVRAPRIEVSASGWNFGERDQGDKDRKVLKLRNTGNFPLQITDVKTTCGCIDIKLHERTLRAGEFAELTLILDAARAKGPVKKYVIIKSNDPNQPELKLLMEGKVNPVWWVKTQNVNLGDLSNGAPAAGHFRIFRRRDKPVRLVRHIFQPQEMNVTVTPFDEKDGPVGWDVRLTFPKHMEAGGFEGMIGLYTDFKPFPFIGVRIAAEFIGNIVLEPSRLSFGAVPMGKTREIRVKVRKTVGDGMKILQAGSKDDIITARIVEDKPGVESTVIFTLTSKSVGRYRGRVFIVVDQPGQRVMELPFSCTVPRARPPRDVHRVSGEAQPRPFPIK